MYKIFVPVYNEGPALLDKLTGMHEYFADVLRDNFEFCVVNDGSTDDTKSLLSTFSLGRSDVRVFDCTGPSRRENLIQTMLAVGKEDDIVGFVDADRSTDESAIIRVISSFMAGADIVIGNRYSSTSKIKRTGKRRILSFLFNWFIRFYFGSKITDHECGFKFFRYPVISALATGMGYDLTRKFFWDSEMLIRAQRHKLYIRQIPVIWHEGIKSSQSFWKDKSMLLYILKLRFRLCK